VAFSSEVNQLTGPALIGAVAQQMMQGYDELHLLLSTPGGHVAQGIYIYNTLMGLPIKITTYNVGTVNSIGNVIFLAGKKRFAARTSSFMFHGVGFDIQAARFEEKVLKERLQGLQNDQKLIADIIVRHTKLTPSAAEKLFLEAAFLRPNDAKRLGIIDKIIDVQIPKGAPFLQLVFQR
jgi:ATP-dependent Clp protease protease subunit